MRVLLETDWKDILSVLSDAEKLQIFNCLLGYPDADCEIGIWKYLKKQIERDRSAYQNRCRGLSDARKNRWAKQSEQIENASDNLTATQSDAVTNSETISNPKPNGSNDVGALIRNFAGNFNPNNERKYEIHHDFSFAELMRRDPGLAEILSSYPETVLIKAERALIEKCPGKRLPFASIMKWVDEQNKHYQ